MTWIVVKRRCSGGHFRQVIQGLVTTAIEYLDCWVDNIQDFFCKLGIQPHMHHTLILDDIHYNGYHHFFTISLYQNYRNYFNSFGLPQILIFKVIFPTQRSEIFDDKFLPSQKPVHLSGRFFLHSFKHYIGCGLLLKNMVKIL